MQHCSSRSLHKYPLIFFLETLCLLGGQRWFQARIWKSLTSMSHLIIVTNIIGSANYQIVDYPLPKMWSTQFLTSRMYVLHSRKWSYLCACTTTQNPFLGRGQHLAKWLSPSILSFLLIFLPPSIPQKSPTFYCKIQQLSYSIFPWAFQWSKFQLSYKLFFLLCTLWYLLLSSDTYATRFISK